MMMWIALVLAVLIVGGLARHAVQDHRYAEQQRQEVLAELEARAGTPLRADETAPTPLPTRADAPPQQRGVVLPPGAGDIGPRQGQVEAR